MDIQFIVPVYNDATNVEPFCQAIEDQFNKIENLLKPKKTNLSILFIDDGSTDESWNSIRTCAQAYQEREVRISIKGISLNRNFGKERALSAGLENARGDLFVVMDSDLQHPPGKICEMLQEMITSDADVIDGVKRDRGCETGMHRFCAKTFYKTMSLLTGMEMQGASDYKLFTKRALLAWRKMGDKNLFFRGMSAWVGLKHSSVEFDVAMRVNGESKWPIKDLISLATTAITAYSTIPLKIISIIGFSFVIFSVLLSIQTLFVYLSGGAITGFSTVILILLISSGLMMLSLGVIGEYVARIYEETKGRPRYLIKEKT